MRRKFYIKDLFNSKHVLDHFGEVEFESWYAFYNAIKKGLLPFSEEQTIIFPINNEKEMEQYIKVIKLTRITDKTKLIIKLTPELFKYLVSNSFFDMKKKYFDVMLYKTDKIILKEMYELNDTFAYWSKQNRVFFELYINKENYKEELNHVITLYLNTKIRFFKLHFDFLSFETMTMGELHEFNYHVSHLDYWKKSSNDKKQGVQSLELYPFGWNLTLFVDEKLRLYINKQAFDEKKVLFSLGEHLNDNGETLDMTTLESLRVYMDVKEIFLIPNLKAPVFMDFYQNKKIMGHVNEIPEVNLMINRLFGGF